MSTQAKSRSVNSFVISQYFFVKQTNFLVECHLCDRRFNQSNNLNKHLKTHGQEKEMSKAMESEMEKMMNNVIMQQQ